MPIVPLSLTFNVQDIGRSLPAYKTLGFRVDDAWKGDDGETYYAELSYEGSEIGLAHIPSNDDPDFQKWVSTPLGAGVVAYLSVRDVDRLHRRAKKAGFLIEQPPTDRSYGRVLMLNDPDGYTLSFIVEPKKKSAATRKARPAAKRKAKAATKKRR